VTLHDTLEALWRSPTIRAMDHDGRVQAVLRSARAAEYVPVMLESPYAGADPRYVHACIRGCIARGEAPIASHVLYTQALDDTVPDERAVGIAAGFALRWLTARTVVYTDLGISAGMLAGVEHARSIGHEIEMRSGVSL
jgi:hypothetical protein